MSPQLEKFLHSAGWSHQRHVSTSKWVDMLSIDGFELIPEAEKIMASFGGLTLRADNQLPSIFQPPVVFFDPMMPGGKADISRIPDWENRLKIKMNPIGELSGGHAVLVFSEDGRIFTVQDGLLYMNGITFEDALENTLVFGGRIPQKICDIIDE